MADINVAWTAVEEELALVSLAGGAMTSAVIEDLDVNDIAGVWIVFNEHTSATDGLEVQVFAREATSGLGTDGVMVGLRQQFTIPRAGSTPGTRLETTVDANSSGTTLNVAATTDSQLGYPIIIDAGDANSEEELALIVGITAGVSLTVADTLVNNPTGANASTVEACMTRYIPLSGMPDAHVTLRNLDVTNACEVAIFSAKRDWTSV